MKAHRKLTERGMLYAQIQDGTEKEYALGIKKKIKNCSEILNPVFFFYRTCFLHIYYRSESLE